MNGMSSTQATMLARAIRKTGKTRGGAAQARRDPFARHENYVFVPIGGTVQTMDHQIITGLTKAVSLKLVTKQQAAIIRQAGEPRPKPSPRA